MRVLIYSDLQATDGHEHCFNNPTESLQLWRVSRFFDELVRIYKLHNCQALFDLGDTTDDRTAIPVSVIDLLCDRLSFFTGEWNLKLVGNHEQLLRDTKVHAGKMLRQFFHVVDTVKAMKFGKVNILCVSYHDDIQKILDFLRRQPKLEKTILIGHFQVAGCQLSGGMAVTGVPQEALKHFTINLLGHIHKPQQLGSNIHYIGSPFQQNWGEAQEDKRVAILDITDQKAALEFVPLEGFPRYRTVGYQEFLDQVKENSEDRYKVVLNSLEETEKLYAHPLCNRCDEAVYAYDQVPDRTEGSDQPIPHSKEEILMRYMLKAPPSEAGVVLDSETLLQFGLSITQPQ